MKKIILISAIGFFATHSFAQSLVTIDNDTLFYKDKKVAVGDTVTFGYGSAANKDFVFILFGNGLAGTTPLPAIFNKLTAVVDKVYKAPIGKFIFRAKPMKRMGGMKIFVDLEAAVDNKELIL